MMKRLIALAKREAILLGGVALSTITVAVGQGTSLQVAVLSTLPLLIAALVRSLTKEICMPADLTALNAEVAQLQAVASSVASTVATLKAEATPQADIDTVTTAVTAAVDTLQAAIS